MLMETRPFSRSAGWVKRSNLVGFGYEGVEALKQLKYGGERKRMDKTTERKKRSITHWGGRVPYIIYPKKTPPHEFITKRGAPILGAPPLLRGF